MRPAKGIIVTARIQPCRASKPGTRVGFGYVGQELYATDYNLGVRSSAAPGW